MNLNQLAKEITKHEGLKKETDIAQIKEVLRCLADILASDFRALKCFVDYIFKAAMK